MRKEINIILTPKQSSSEKNILSFLSKKFQIPEDKISYLKILSRSVDARSRNVKINLKVLFIYNEEKPSIEKDNFIYQDVKGKEKIIIVGSGPSGLFAALRAIELGFCPVILERGKMIEERRKDIRDIYRIRKINENSNYSFGEGGAGAFSDGKLFTRSKKRGDVKKILKILAFNGAKENILYESKAHIGTDKLPKIIENIRNLILNSNGEIHFNTKLEDFIIEKDSIKKVKTKNTLNGEIKYFTGKYFILATGHSARDIYNLLYEKNILLEEKNFSVGVRVEHSQNLIDSIQYHTKKRSPYLEAANYNLVTQINGRGVYSFCMCPGGFIVPASTKNNQLVLNGMSPSNRNSKYANSGIVVEVKSEDLENYKKFGVLAGMKFQEDLEKLAFEESNKSMDVPAQRMLDFTRNKKSKSLQKSSYFLGVTSSEMHLWLPKEIRISLQKAFIKFNKKMKNFLTNEAIILGVESRTSSPIRIPRDKKTLQHLQIKNLFPCGEGAGYSGGIVSSAIDGQRCVESISFINNQNKK